MKKMCLRRLAELKTRIFERIKERLEQTNLVKQMIPEMPQSVAVVVEVNGISDGVMYGSSVFVLRSRNSVTLLSVNENGGVVQVRRYDNAKVVEDTRPMTVH